MICEACKYDSDKNEKEKDWQFWKMDGVFFEFERQEFTDVKDIAKVEMYLCPKCHSPHYEITEQKEIVE